MKYSNKVIKLINCINCMYCKYFVGFHFDSWEAMLEMKTFKRKYKKKKAVDS
jgi:hypothetical protein